MAKSFKQLLGDDIRNSRTMLHEAIPITGTIASGTYTGATLDENVKKFSHGMFESVYDYPYLSSSANHIFDITYGCSSAVSSSGNTQNAKKLNIYNQMAQVLMGYDTGSQIRKFDSDGTLNDAGAGQMDHCFFLNFSRLLSKDEIKKNSFRLQLYTSGSVTGDGSTRGVLQTLGDYNSANQFRISPAGDYGLIFTASAATYPIASSVGVLFYQAGIAVLTSSIFQKDFGTPVASFADGAGGGGASASRAGIGAAQTGSTIEALSDGLRHTLYDIDFNNTIELNSTIYFCRVGHNEFNYSSNPTYVSGSRLVIKNQASDLPLTYITTIGLYSPDNELMAVAKLSEPIRKDPNTELTLRVRLDY
jgi:hypothetical protein|tara:strand:+ start:2520 stop:3605 length:1086 start_codon:yes stop_codon:yes gene_type:complete